MELQDLLDQAAADAVAKGFDPPDLPTFVALAHSELSEVLEEYRSGHDLTRVYYSAHAEGPLKPEGIPIELADTVIRIAHYCGQNGIDLVSAISEKLAFNRTRPFKHGKKI